MRMLGKSRRRSGGALTLFMMVGGGLLWLPQAASAQTCINEVWKAHGNNQNVTCTANDVTLSAGTNINILTGGSCDPVTGACGCFAGQQVTFTADFRMDLTADTRYDVGFYIATDNDPNKDGALTGQCAATASLASNTTRAGNFINLDAAPDVCGDITGNLTPGTGHNPLYVTAQITAQCPTVTGQKLQLPFATTWRQPGSNQVCAGTGNGTTTNSVFPGSPSKCNKGTLVLDIVSVDTTIVVTKDALTPSVPEDTGGEAAFNVKVENKSGIDVTLQSLVDDPYGSITQVGLRVTETGCVADGNPATCELGGVILAGGQCSCMFKATISPGDFPGSVTDKVTACANNISNPSMKCADDSAEVAYSDKKEPPSLSKTVGNTQCQIDVTYNVVVTNRSGQDALYVKALVDNIYGDITQVQGGVQSTTCGQAGLGGGGTLPFLVPASGSYSCAFVGRITSCDTTVVDIVTGTTTDDDGANYSPTGQATVVVSAGPPKP